MIVGKPNDIEYSVIADQEYRIARAGEYGEVVLEQQNAGIAGWCKGQRHGSQRKIDFRCELAKSDIGEQRCSEIVVGIKIDVAGCDRCMHEPDRWRDVVVGEFSTSGTGAHHPDAQIAGDRRVRIKNTVDHGRCASLGDGTRAIQDIVRIVVSCQDELVIARGRFKRERKFAEGNRRPTVADDRYRVRRGKIDVELRRGCCEVQGPGLEHGLVAAPLAFRVFDSYQGRRRQCASQRKHVFRIGFDVDNGQSQSACERKSPGNNTSKLMLYDRLSKRVDVPPL